jgi:hypothetical protein
MVSSISSRIPAVQKNEYAMNQIDSFRDVPWTIGFCKTIKDDFRKTPEKALSLLISCGMKEKEFTAKQREKFMQYLDKDILLGVRFRFRFVVPQVHLKG